MRRRLKNIDIQKNENEKFVSEQFMNIDGDFRENMPYGDSALFVSKMLINMNKMKITHDSHFKICQQFYATDFWTLQMLGMVTSKNNLVIGMVYPRLTYLYSSKTALQIGLSTGSVKKMLVGATHIHSPSLIYGFQSQYCAH